MTLAGRTRAELLETILEGGFPEGRLPPEQELAAQLGVSRTTVRTALQSLERDGFITRKRRLGTLVNSTVAPYRLGLHRLVGFSTLLAEQGHVPAVQIEARSAGVLEPDWAERLDAPMDTPAHLVSKLFLADGRPAISILDIVPHASLAALPPVGDIPDAIFRLFDTHGRARIDHATLELVPAKAGRAVARRLAVPPGKPYFALRETHYSARGEPLALSNVDVNDDYIRFVLVRRAD